MISEENELRVKELLVHSFKFGTREILQFFHEKTEAERRELAPLVARCHRAATLRPGGGRAMSEFRAHRTSIALAATATLAEMKKLRSWESEYDTVRAIIDRRPPWLAESIDLLLDRVDNHWRIADVAYLIHQLVLDGDIPAPNNHRYSIGLAFAFGGYREHIDEKPYSYRIRDDKTYPIVDDIRPNIDGLRTAIWRQFEIEGDDVVSLMVCQIRRESEHGGWAGALKILADEALLDRQRLLDCSVEALARGFSAYRARWFCQFHDLLAPTAAEREARTELYFDLLSSPNLQILGLVVTSLKIISKHGLLDPVRTIVRTEPALYCKSKTIALGALELLLKALTQRPDLAERVLELVAVCFEHPEISVQEKALSSVERYATLLGARAREAIASRFEISAPSLRARIGALIDTPEIEDAVEIVVSATEIHQRIERLPREIRIFAGIEAVLTAQRDGAADVPRAIFTAMDVPHLAPEQAIKPIESFEKLIDAALHAIQTPNDLELVERVLAGALRLSSLRPENADRLLSPLRKSLERLESNQARSISPTSPLGNLRMVLSALVSIQLRDGYVWEYDPTLPMYLRAKSIAKAIETNASMTMLSEPTHGGFWIDPIVVVERTLAGGNFLGIADQVLCLLRLAPDRRAKALERAAQLSGEWGAVLRFALGGKERPASTNALWTTAFKVRILDPANLNPESAFSSYEQNDDSPLELQFSKMILSSRTINPDANPSFVQVGFDRDKKSKRINKEFDEIEWSPLFYMNNLSFISWFAYIGDGFLHGDWFPAIWPQNPEPAFCFTLLQRCMSDEPVTCSVAAGLTHILNRDVPIGPTAVLMVCRGLNTKDDVNARASVDALIALIEDGRVDGETLGAAIHDLLSLKLVVARRWPARLSDVAQSSPIAKLVIRRALERSFWPLDASPAPKDFHMWIDVLRNLNAETGYALVDPSAIAGLQSYGRSGRAHEAVKALFAQSPQVPVSRSAVEVFNYALLRRVQRAERWNKVSTHTST